VIVTNLRELPTKTLKRQLAYFCVLAASAIDTPAFTAFILAGTTMSAAEIMILVMTDLPCHALTILYLYSLRIPAIDVVI